MLNKKNLYFMIVSFLPVFCVADEVMSNRYEIYTFHETAQNPITIKLDTFLGDSWAFNGIAWKQLKESGTKNNYDFASYKLSFTDSKDGVVIFRFSQQNGSAWIYTDHGWEFVETSTE
ncbi:hypothetical protein [Zooshikella harenae]|uniref:Secreted protein n=1 Tax=Zooshikella harenae TaxID=2827238 RepID=A0ABS5ZBA0_9GAMM|nr:hypothetical protein [Zooshikella harenae]MBU2710520.1 hypothetical protein [Zooshikella harenae]